MKNSRVRLRYEILETPGLKPSTTSADEFRRKFQGSTAKTMPKQYTGTEMLCVSTMHKSNAVPVFNHEAIRDISNMRR